MVCVLVAHASLRGARLIVASREREKCLVKKAVTQATSVNIGGIGLGSRLRTRDSLRTLYSRM